MTAPTRHVWAALAVVYVVWGSTYFGIKVVVDTMPPLFAAGSRFLAAGLLLALVLAVRRTSLRVSPRELGASALAGGLMLGVGVGLVHVAETRIDSSVAAMIAGTVPLQIVVLRLAAGESPARATRLSTLAGLLGLGLIIAPGLAAGSTALGLAVMVSATMSWSLGSFLSRRLPLPRDPFVATAYEMSAAGVLLLLGAAAFGEFADVGPEAFGAHSLLAWAYLAVIGSVVAFTAYAWLLRVAPISLVVTHQYVNPVIAITLGVLLLAERPSPLALLGAIVVVSAVYVTVREESRRARASEPIAEPTDAPAATLGELERAA